MRIVGPWVLMATHTACGQTDNMRIEPKCAYTVLETIDPTSAEGQALVAAQWEELQTLSEVDLLRDDGTVAFQDTFTWTVDAVVVERRHYADARPSCQDDATVTALSGDVAMTSRLGLELEGSVERIAEPDHTYHDVGAKTVDDQPAPPAYLAENCTRYPEPDDVASFAMGYEYPDIPLGAEPAIYMVGGNSCRSLLVVPTTDPEAGD